MVDRTCSIDGCGGRHKGRGYCAKHLQRVKKFGSPHLPVKQEKPPCSVAECDRQSRTMGMCAMHYHRKLMTGTVESKPRATMADRFWAKVEKTDYCWNWTASTDGTGYGKFLVGDRLQPAHRVSYELANGPIPDGMLIDHRCFNHGCVNPEHLRLATRAQNGENRRGADVDSRAGIRGIYQETRTRRWVAEVRSNGKLAYRELFDSQDEAAEAARAARLRIFTHTQER